MGNTDWWGPTAPQTPQQQFHAQQAAQLQKNWDAEARAFEEERRRRKKRAEWHLLIAGGSLLLGLGLFAVGLAREGGIFLVVTLYSGRVGIRDLLRTD
jgi:hypothetical protein